MFYSYGLHEIIMAYSYGLHEIIIVLFLLFTWNNYGFILMFYMR